MTDESWAQFAQLQAKANSTTTDDTYWATDDALDHTLDRIAAGQPMPTEQQLDDLIGNRRRKHRTRRRTLESIYFEIAKDLHRDRSDRRHIEGQVGALTDASKALTRLTAREQRIVLGLAVGHTHNELSKTMNKPVGSIKTLAHRAKHKIAA